MKKSNLTRKEKRSKAGSVWLTAMAAAALLAGCGSADVSKKPEVLLTHEEKAIVEYMEGGNLGQMTEEDYFYVARLFSDRDKWRDRRDLLEECVLLLGSEEAEKEWLHGKVIANIRIN